MEHDWASERLADFEAGELPNQEIVRVRKHLEVCSACCDALEHWRQTRAALSRLTEPKPADPFIRQAMTRVKALPETQSSPGVFHIPDWRYPELGIAAAATVLFVVGYFGFPVETVSAETVLMSRKSSGAEWMNALQEPDKSALDILSEGT